MDGEISQLVYGAIGGGLVAALFRIAEQWIERRSVQSLEARRTLAKYAKPLWLACHELEQRLTHIHAGLKNPQALTRGPEMGFTLDWYTKEGYYATSTVYLFACVSAWITLFQRDLVFLEFKRESLTAQFFQCVEHFKISISHWNDSLVSLPRWDRPAVASGGGRSTNDAGRLCQHARYERSIPRFLRSEFPVPQKDRGQRVPRPDRHVSSRSAGDPAFSRCQPGGPSVTRQPEGEEALA
jgi:hypothetical protein